MFTKIPPRHHPVAFVLFCVSIGCSSLLAGCGGDGQAERLAVNKQSPSAQILGTKDTPLSTHSSESVEMKPLATPKFVTPPKPATEENMKETNDAALRLALRQISYLSSLTNEQLEGMIKQLRNKSPTQRNTLLDAYPSLAKLPMQQKSILLEKLEKVVPITTMPSSLMCKCGNGRVSEICVKDLCEDTAALQFSCSRACGTTDKFTMACRSSNQCAIK